MTVEGGAARTDVVELSIPVRADLVVLARLTAATMASRADFGVEEIEDLRLAVEELCLSIVRSDGGGRLHFTYRREDDTVRIACSLEAEPEDEPSHASDDRVLDDLSLRILDALVDQHGRELRDGRPSAWLSKRRARSSVP